MKIEVMYSYWHKISQVIKHYLHLKQEGEQAKDKNKKLRKSVIQLYPNKFSN